jgi:ComF family protein
MWNAVLDLLFPPSCAACSDRLQDRDPAPFCATCAQSVDSIQVPYCTSCGEPFDAEGPCHPCARCLRHPPSFARARAPFVYGGALLEAIHRYKYRRAWDLGRSLGELLACSLDRTDLQPANLVLPVPLHPRRLQERGFDQAVPLARAVSRRLGAPMLPRALRRIRHTPAQTRLSGRARWENVAGAFAVPRPPQVASARILLIDDVLTTGATARACSRALLAAGASHVEVLTLARTA